MANIIEKAEQVANQGIGLLQREIVLPRLVIRKGINDFRGAKDDTINHRIPSLLVGRDYEWRTRNSPITVDELNETKIPIELDKHPYNAVAVTDEELTLDITSWGEQVGGPQTRAVAERLEGYVATGMQEAETAETVDYTPGDGSADDYSFHDALVDAGTELNDENVPLSGRFVVLGSNVANAAKKSRYLVDVDRSGSSDLLREAIIGRVAGFTVVESNAIDPDFAMAAHPTAFVLGNVAPAVPNSVPGATVMFEGLSLRWIQDYDSSYLRERSVYSSFAGVASVADQRDMDPESETYLDLTGLNARAVEITFNGESVGS